MQVLIWIKRQHALSGNGKIIDYYTTEPVSNLKDPDKHYTEYVQVSVTQDEFARLEDGEYNNNKFNNEH